MRPPLAVAPRENVRRGPGLPTFSVDARINRWSRCRTTTPGCKPGSNATHPAGGHDGTEPTLLRQRPTPGRSAADHVWSARGWLRSRGWRDRTRMPTKPPVVMLRFTWAGHWRSDRGWFSFRRPKIDRLGCNGHLNRRRGWAGDDRGALRCVEGPAPVNFHGMPTAPNGSVLNALLTDSVGMADGPAVIVAGPAGSRIATASETGGRCPASTPTLAPSFAPTRPTKSLPPGSPGAHCLARPKRSFGPGRRINGGLSGHLALGRQERTPGTASSPWQERRRSRCPQRPCPSPQRYGRFEPGPPFGPTRSPNS